MVCVCAPILKALNFQAIHTVSRSEIIVQLLNRINFHDRHQQWNRKIMHNRYNMLRKRRSKKKVFKIVHSTEREIKSNGKFFIILRWVSSVGHLKIPSGPMWIKSNIIRFISVMTSQICSLVQIWWPKSRKNGEEKKKRSYQTYLSDQLARMKKMGDENCLSKYISYITWVCLICALYV